MTSDLSRYCVYCDADCYLDDPEHEEDCPFTTGVWAVLSENQILCSHCGKDIHGPSLCAECKSPLEVGDHYILRDMDSHELVVQPTGGSINERICIGCAATQGLFNNQQEEAT